MELTQAQFASALGVSRQTVAQLLLCRRNVSADMAHRLSRALNATPGVWMRLQEAFDLWVTEKKNRQQYAKIAALKSVKVEVSRCCTIPITSRISGFVCDYY